MSDLVAVVVRIALRRNSSVWHHASNKYWEISLTMPSGPGDCNPITQRCQARAPVQIFRTIPTFALGQPPLGGSSASPAEKKKDHAHHQKDEE
jgi:hypothetical protein